MQIFDQCKKYGSVREVRVHVVEATREVRVFALFKLPEGGTSTFATLNSLLPKHSRLPACFTGESPGGRFLAEASRALRILPQRRFNKRPVQCEPYDYQAYCERRFNQ